MIMFRALRAIPYVLFAAAAGSLWSLAFGFPVWLGAVLWAAIVSAMIGRDIWKQRHDWNDLNERIESCGRKISDF